MPAPACDSADTLDVTPVWDRDVGLVRAFNCECMTVSTFRRALTEWERAYFSEMINPKCPIHGER